LQKTRLSVTTLNQYVVNALIEEDIPAVSISPFPLWVTQNKAIVKDGLQQVVDTLGQGLIPVIHGDAVLDTTLGATILSGDAIIEFLVLKLKPKFVVFLTDVAGIYTGPPNEIPNAQLIPLIQVPTELVSISTTTASHDVTGGIKSKLQCAYNMTLKTQIPVYIVQINSPSAYEIITNYQDTNNELQYLESIGWKGTKICYKNIL